jgi:hypothetical protein
LSRAELPLPKIIPFSWADAVPGLVNQFCPPPDGVLSNTFISLVPFICRVIPAVRPAQLSGHEHKYDDVRGKGFFGQTRRERRAYPAVDL